jgi:hypothetical protein
MMLNNPAWQWSVVTLCRGSDVDRAPRFRRVMKLFSARGAMGDLDDGPQQDPLSPETVEQLICELLPPLRFDLLLTHGPRGEYTRHLRHEECCRGVLTLWDKGLIRADEVWFFAYEDGRGKYLPRAQATADKWFPLPEAIWQEKQRLVRELYGFNSDSWEARTTPKVEAFHVFRRPSEAAEYVAAMEQIQ